MHLNLSYGIHALEAGQPALSSETDVACLSVKPSECFQTLCARSPALQRKPLHRCCALGRAQALLSGIFPFLPCSIFHIRLPKATPAALRMPPRKGSMHLIRALRSLQMIHRPEKASKPHHGSSAPLPDSTKAAGQQRRPRGCSACSAALFRCLGISTEAQHAARETA